MATKTEELQVTGGICEQNDFLGPKGITDFELSRRPTPLPLHGRQYFSERILGGKNEPNPYDDFQRAIHTPPRSLKIKRHNWKFYDWHNAKADAKHLKMFFDHCLENKAGAKFVGDIDEIRRIPGSNSELFKNPGLSIFSNPGVQKTLRSLIKRYEISDPKQVKFLLTGGLTNILVRMLAEGAYASGLPDPLSEGRYDLVWTFENVAVAEEKCFSNNVTDHDSAIEGMAAIGIQILRNDAECYQYLGINPNE